MEKKYLFLENSDIMSLMDGGICLETSKYHKKDAERKWG